MAFPAPNAADEKKTRAGILAFYVLLGETPCSFKRFLLPVVRLEIAESLPDGPLAQSGIFPHVIPDDFSPFCDTSRPLHGLFLSHARAFKRLTIINAHQLGMTVYNRFPAERATLGFALNSIGVQTYSPHPVFLYLSGSV